MYNSEIDSLISIYELGEAEELVETSISYKKSISNLNFGNEYYRLSIIYKKKESSIHCRYNK